MKIDETPISELLSVSDAVVVANLARATIMRAIRFGQLQSIRHGGRIYIMQGELTDWVRGRQHPGDGWLTISQAADLVGVSRQSVYQRFLSGQFEWKKTDKLYIREDQVRQLFADRSDQ